MDLRLAEDIWELHQKFELVAKPWTLNVNDKLRKFSDNAKLIVSGDGVKPHTYTVQFMIPNYNYKDTESADFWDPFVRVMAESDFPETRHIPRNVWAKVEKDVIMSHDEDQRIPGWPVTTLYNYEEENSKMTESELCSLSKKFGDEWKELAEHTLEELTPNFVDKYMNKDVDYYPSVTVNTTTWKNAPLISPGAKSLQGKIKKIKIIVQSDRICKARFVIHAKGWKRPTPNIDAEGIRHVWG